MRVINKLMTSVALATAVMAGSALVSSNASANSVFIGEQFDFVATQISPPGAGTGTGTITIGTPTSGGFYTISDASFISALKGCLSCTVLTEDLNNLFFDSILLGITGTTTGTFLGDNGDLHDFSLSVADAPTLTWDFIKTDLVTDITKESSGTYFIAETPLPAALPLFATGLGALGLLARSRKRKAAIAA
ncbi:MAG TPA: VPLPA-CTERM sorting domain-containing protein [Pseudolabrys sp.]|nr:VPLPA-CTERM sorting domain-containing protein [Pseudolabrys sp.]